MANTSVTYEGDGLQTVFSVPFPYRSPLHVKVLLNGIPAFNPAVYTLNSSSVVFREAPANGTAIKVFRETPGDTRLVDFQNGAVLTEADLDLSADQLFYLIQEVKENLTSLINGEIFRIGSSQGVVDADPDLVIAGLVEKMLEDANADNLQQRIADIDANAESILQLGTDLQIQLNTLAQGIAATVFVQPGEPVPGVGGVPDPIPEGARWYDSDDNNKPYIYQSSAWVSIEDPRIGQAVANISVLQTDVAGNAAAIVTEQLARSTADTALASELALLGVQNAGQTAFILNSSTVKLDSDVGDTLANRFSQLTAADSDNAALVVAEQTARANADAALASDLSAANARIDLQDSAIAGNASSISSLDSRVTVNEGTISSQASSITALQSSVTSVTGRVSTAEVTIAANTSAISSANGDISTLEARYGVNLNVNGYVTGFIQNNDGQTGSFVILADKFAIVDPSGDPGEPQFIPFSVSGGVVSMQNVQINGSLVVNGTINTPQLSNKATTDITVRPWLSSVQVYEGVTNVVDEVTVTTEANDVVELNVRWAFQNTGAINDGQSGATIFLRIRRFDGATPAGFVGGTDNQWFDAWGEHWERSWERETTRFQVPGAGTWTYKVEVGVPTPMDGNYFVQDFQLVAKVFKKSA